MKYDSYQNFFNAIKDADHTNHVTLSLFCQLVNTINVGCGCKRNAREQATINKYKTLSTELTPEEITYLKEAVDTEIEFYQNNDFYGKI